MAKSEYCNANICMRTTSGNNEGEFATNDHQYSGGDGYGDHDNDNDGATATAATTTACKCSWGGCISHIN